MKNGYTYYEYSDFLMDDFFVGTMIRPTDKSQLYWKKILDDGEMNTDAFIKANLIMETYRNSRAKMSDYCEDRLWRKIESDINSRRRRAKAIRYGMLGTLVAACFAVLLALVLPTAPTVENAPDAFRYHVINRQQLPDEIVIVSNDKQTVIEDENPEVSYNRQGALAINGETVARDKTPEKTAVINQLSVPFGKQAQLKLSDGSMLWVNTGTTVLYPSVFLDGKREIYVDGEIYASVAHDAKRPFIVRTEELQVLVHGTEFNLSAYKKDQTKQVVLVNGSVEVEYDGASLQLSPKQMYNLTGQKSTIRIVDTELYTSWRKGIYIFRDEPVEKALLKLARYYNVTMSLSNINSGVVCFGEVELKDELPALLTSLSYIVPLDFSVKDNQYQIQFK
ncbi:MAG: FecR domain-containing protein [Prevotella sp.]|jgi:ferric-dicitrate binding protein FerR (iron transport regulator)|nr:FecR domain-containing protein [Prevotella sp.]